MFAMVTEKGYLERVLRLAQIATLSPERESVAIADSDDINQPTTLSFSRNVIRLEIVSAELPDLSL